LTAKWELYKPDALVDFLNQLAWALSTPSTAAGWDASPPDKAKFNAAIVTVVGLARVRAERTPRLTDELA
jgi:hypothetical protein